MLLGYVYFNNYYDIKDYQTRLALISQKYAALNKEVFRIVEYKEEWDSLHHKISLTSQLKGKQIWWTPKLQGLGELVPGNIWISQISVQRSAPAPRKVISSGAKASPAQVGPSVVLILEGFALPGDNRGLRSVENFAHELNKNPAFSRIMEEINLTMATRTEKEKVPAISFRLSCRLAEEKSL